MKKTLFIILLVTLTGACAQAPVKNKLDLLGTRSWIKITWPKGKENISAYRIYWSQNQNRPRLPNVTLNSEAPHYYIDNVIPETTYSIWVECVDKTQVIKQYTDSVVTSKKWKLVGNDMQELKRNPSSTAVPKGMRLFWHDEFNDLLLNRNKWFVTYYSTIDHLRGEFKKNMQEGKLPKAAYSLNGNTIDLFVNDSLPLKIYDKENGKKISSIQTYNWRTNENLLDNSRGGYFEVRVKRSSTGSPKGLNTAFWFDSPGQDLKYYLEQGTSLMGVTGIRPKGQAFEIDIFEYLSAQFVLHGHVNEKGEFQHNLATHIAKGHTHVDNWVVHGILWTPTSIKHYINGELIKAYTDKYQIYSPNHFMNVLLGSYGAGGSVNMEVDYIRGYQWPLKDGNELPNPGFEDSGNLAPWEGTGNLTTLDKKTGNYAVLLKPGESIEQYVYLNNNTSYKLDYWIKGADNLKVSIFNVTPVTGKPEQIVLDNLKGSENYTMETTTFITGKEPDNNMKTIRLLFVNHGTYNIYIDDIMVIKN